MSRICRSVLIGSCLVLFSGTAFSDSTLQFVQTRVASGETPQQQTVRVAHGKVRIDTLAGAETTTLIFDPSSGSVTVIDPQEHSYQVMSEQKMAAIGRGAQAKSSAAEKMMRQHMQDMTPEERKQMQAMLGDMQDGTARSERYEKTSIGHTVNGFRCYQVNIYEGSVRTGEVCMAKRGKLGISRANYHTLRSMYTMMERMNAAMGVGKSEISRAAVDALPGIPVRMVDTGSSGQHSVMELKQIDHRTLSNKLFAIPAGYRQRQIPADLR